MEDIRKRMLRGARNRAAKAGVPFSITVDDIQIPTHCPVFGFPLTRTSGRAGDTNPSLDKIIPEDGYVPGNIVVTSLRANRAKGNLTVAELAALADFYGHSLNTSRVRHGRRVRTRKDPA